ncbi:hypothetical protein [Rhodomicrobium lacus]|uniref:hypothetical protein n=1 Tax=Rhodomicrobium lacus TaxID=2498452 RepID=UPI0026E38964|nr:hypothetical protein [Rhodomicrobium lacus]WKW49639.1 hypothetical protein QMO75_10035 [Rhodomicrobium lacus]
MAAKTKTEAGKKTGGKKTSPEKQALIMWALLAKENAGAFRGDLKPTPEKADREALEDAGLIKWWKVGQKIWIEVSDKGWAWANENLGHALPAQSNAGAEILRGWLVKLDAFLNARGLALADVLAAQPAPSKTNGHDKTPPKVPAGSLRDRIRTAYLDATGGRFNTRALLKDIRTRLADVERATLDEALTLMQREDAAVLYPLDNRAEITDADRAASISFAGEPRHILWIER